MRGVVVSAARQLSPTPAEAPEVGGETGAETGAVGGCPPDVTPAGTDEGGADGGAPGAAPGAAGNPLLCPSATDAVTSTIHAANKAVRFTTCLPAKRSLDPICRAGSQVHAEPARIATREYRPVCPSVSRSIEPHDRVWIASSLAAHHRARNATSTAGLGDCGARWVCVNSSVYIKRLIKFSSISCRPLVLGEISPLPSM